MTEALATRPPQPIAEIERMADYVIKSKLFGGLNKEQAVALMLVCQAKGLHPMEAVERYHIIQGRHSMRADAMLAEFQRRGGKITWRQSNADAAEAEFMATGLGKPFVYRYTLDMAKRAGLTGKDNWRKDPEAMLRARCITGGVRATDPGVNQGTYTPDEVEDFDAPRARVVDVTPAADRPKLTLAAVTKAPDPEVAAEVVPEPVADDFGDGSPANDIMPEADVRALYARAMALPAPHSIRKEEFVDICGPKASEVTRESFEIMSEVVARREERAKADAEA